MKFKAFNNLAELLIGLSLILARRKVIYVATSNWKCFIQKVLTLKEWLLDEVLFYIRDGRNRVKVYVVRNPLNLL